MESFKERPNRTLLVLKYLGDNTDIDHPAMMAPYLKLQFATLIKVITITKGMTSAGFAGAEVFIKTATAKESKKSI